VGSRHPITERVAGDLEESAGFGNIPAGFLEHFFQPRFLDLRHQCQKWMDET
jgi:hypothetical protein